MGMIDSNKKTYFFVCPLGFEQIQHREILFWESKLGVSSKEIKVDKGGVEVVGSLNYLVIVPYLKTTTRVLMRVTEFKVRDFPKLYNKVKKFNWSSYLYKENVQIRISLKESRIIHSGKAEDSIRKGFEAWIKGNPRKKIKEETPEQKIHFMIKNDLCVVSIDLCGRDLYKRENKKQGAIAPIRENLASGLILWSLEKLSKNSDIDFIDPMCGSGTFILEAENLYKKSNRQNFSFHYIPLTKDYVEKKNFEEQAPFKSLLGIDKNNFFNESREETKNIRFINSDYSTAIKSIPQEGFIIFNPPYGKRIKINTSLKVYYKKILEELMQLSPIGLGLIIPEGTPLKSPSNDYERESIKFKNGGMKVDYVLFTKKL